MGAALEAGYDLGGLAGCYVAIALLEILATMLAGLAGALDIGIFGVHPFSGLASAVRNTLIRGLNSAIRSLERLAARFESGLIDAFGIILGLSLLLGIGVRAALVYLWNHALDPAIRLLTDPIEAAAHRALADVTALAGTVAANVGRAERYARDRATAAAETAEAYADRRIDAAVGTVRRDIAAALSTAERYADGAVGKLRAAEDAAIADAVSLASQARAAGEAAARRAEAEAEAAGAAALTAAQRLEAQALAQAQAAGAAALATVKTVAVGAADDLATLEGQLGAAGAAALIAAIPALATMVQAIATEAGLSNAECRTKVKGICGTDPFEWGGLLAGAAFLTGALSLRELTDVGRVAVRELAGVIREAA